jgi:adenylate kinase
VPLNLIMLGAPGAGKGTQAGRLSRLRNIPHISTGEILRAAIAAGTDVGRRAKAFIEHGELVSDDLILRIVQDRLSETDASRGFILDGVPRTVKQAMALDAMMAERDPLIIVDIEVPAEELERRLVSRRICRDCGLDAAAMDDTAELAKRSKSSGVTRCRRCGGPIVQRVDDNAEIVRERLKVYERQTAPLVEYYRDRPTFRAINGLQSPERVADDIGAAIDDVRRSAVGQGAPR